MNVHHVFAWLGGVFAIGGGIALIRFIWVTDGMKDMSSRWAMPLGAFAFSAAPLGILFELLSRPLVGRSLFDISSSVFALAGFIVCQSVIFVCYVVRGSASARKMNPTNQSIESAVSQPTARSSGD